MIGSGLLIRHLWIHQLNKNDEDAKERGREILSKLRHAVKQRKVVELLIKWALILGVTITSFYLFGFIQGYFFKIGFKYPYFVTK